MKNVMLYWNIVVVGMKYFCVIHATNHGSADKRAMQATALTSILWSMKGTMPQIMTFLCLAQRATCHVGRYHLLP